MTTFSLAVLSDLHAFDEKDETGEPSFLCTKHPETPSTHPLAALEELIRIDSLRADLLLCPGDLTDKARPASLKWAWDRLNELRNKLNATAVFATAGNHDLDSRYRFDKKDPRELVLSLSPRFPGVATDELWHQFWSVHYCLVDVQPHCRVALLNSSAYHGGAPDQLEHGSISEGTLDRLRDALVGTSRPINVLLCHHHPQLHSELRLGQYDEMENGQRLLDLLSEITDERWLVVHGHKHHPKLTRAAGSSLSPIVFSAGSFSFDLHGALGTSARNQFYLVEISVEKALEGRLCGCIRAWDWHFGRGWAPASAQSGLAARSGFGASRDPHLLTVQIEQWLTEPFVSWQDVVSEFEDAQYLLPVDLHLLARFLKKRGILLSFSEHGIPQQLGRPVL